MLRVLLICLLLVGCTDKREEQIKHAKKQALNFCGCLKTSVRVTQFDQYQWSVWCEDGTNSLNTNYEAEYSCP